MSPDDGTRRGPTPASASWRRCLGLLLAAISVAALTAYTASTPLLTWLGDQLIHADPPERVDALVVLASGVDRIIEAAELYRAGYAPLVILTKDPSEPYEAFLERRGVAVENSEERRLRILEALEVPRSSVLVFEQVVRSTAEEAFLVARWTRRHSVRSVMIVTSPAHTARSRLAFTHALRDLGVKVVVRPSQLALFRRDSWWRSRDTLREGIIEWQKLVYYRLVEVWRAPPAIE